MSWRKYVSASRSEVFEQDGVTLGAYESSWENNMLEPGVVVIERRKFSRHYATYHVFINGKLAQSKYTFGHDRLTDAKEFALKQYAKFCAEKMKEEGG